MSFVVPKNEDMVKVIGNINLKSSYAMAKCACVACNSCTCACSCRISNDFTDIWA